MLFNLIACAVPLADVSGFSTVSEKELAFFRIPFKGLSGACEITLIGVKADFPPPNPTLGLTVSVAGFFKNSPSSVGFPNSETTLCF